MPSGRSHLGGLAGRCAKNGDEPTTPGDDSTDTGTDTDDGTGSGGGLAQTGDNTVALVGGVALAAVALVAGGVVLRRRASR